MTIIEVKPSKKFKGAWVAFEALGVEPSFQTADPRAAAIEYAKGRFGGSAGEIRVYDEAGEKITETIAIDGRGQYAAAR